MRTRLRLLSLCILIATVLSLGIIGGVYLDRFVLLSNGYIPRAAQTNFRLMAEAWNTINKVYVDRSAIQPVRLTYGAISGMVDSLGDTGHSTFLTPEDAKQEGSYLRGQFEGIGAEVQMKDDHVVIFGTGTVLDQFPLSDGSALMLATEEWLTPNGRAIWHKGILPDVEVKLATDINPLIPEVEKGMTPAQLKNYGDMQVLKALQILTQTATEKWLKMEQSVTSEVHRGDPATKTAPPLQGYPYIRYKRCGTLPELCPGRFVYWQNSGPRTP